MEQKGNEEFPLHQQCGGTYNEGVAEVADGGCWGCIPLTITRGFKTPGVMGRVRVRVGIYIPLQNPYPWQVKVFIKIFA